MSDKTVMEEANEIVFGARAQAYGHPKENFSRICLLWNAYLDGLPKIDNEGWVLDEKDHAIMMILVKIARLQETPDHRDSLVDICGYAGTYEKLLRREAEETDLEKLVRDWQTEDIAATFDVDPEEVPQRTPQPGETWKLTKAGIKRNGGERTQRESVRLEFYMDGDDLWYTRRGADAAPWANKWELVANKNDWEPA